MAAVLHTASGDVFCKGASVDAPTAWTHRREAQLNQFVPPIAPRIRWHIATGGWVVNGFDRALGRHVDVTPGSPDLPVLASTLTMMSTVRAPAAMIQPATARWAAAIAPDLVDGDILIHTDATPKNYVIEGNSISVVDWSAPCRGAAWIDTALMVIRLIRAGHTPDRAEQWAGLVPAWSSAPRHAVTAFVEQSARRLNNRAQTSPAVHLRELAQAATSWASART
ncbi:hypothetical protein [Kineosporia babensis]|uniref:Aminoglycoside phosphotransferase n=1 Tax=Kineosporia babensis TaxID=499548 RepID=A0A9X1NLC2_9ACTN|nr:hypothetical protein [Kineosporia babensis]MCD5315899.1 hypothetical protein [Kineosporia babensis]